MFGTDTLRTFAFGIVAACLAAMPAAAAIEEIRLPPSRQHGLDMIVVDEDALPAEPELATTPADAQVETFGAAAVDPAAPVHRLYGDLRHQLDRYRERWGGLPQLRIGGEGAAIGAGASDPRLGVLRQRLGLARQGSFDKALRARLVEFQKAHGLAPDGRAGAETIAALNLGAAHYERLIQLNMERARRLPAADSGKYLLVDAGAARLWMYEDGKPVDSMKVVVGAPATETPMLAAMIRYLSVNPYWNVPPELVQSLIARRVLEQGLGYLSERRYQVFDGWGEDAALVDPATVDWAAVASGEKELRVRQLPGGGNSMGGVKFMMPNHYGIYLHDTPNKTLFGEAERWVSNGCVRVEDARRLANWLHGELPAAASPDVEERVDLARPVPVYITYFTVEADAKTLAFRKDRYERDAAVLARFPADDRRMVDPDEQFRQAMTLGG
ncbi:MAG: L,D-transpeptidase family protein [Novosphingobium sp.]|nr:L,D-transpeptidase family protein [Novosphingobium sp.]